MIKNLIFLKWTRLQRWRVYSTRCGTCCLLTLRAALLVCDSCLCLTLLQLEDEEDAFVLEDTCVLNTDNMDAHSCETSSLASSDSGDPLHLKRHVRSHTQTAKIQTMIQDFFQNTSIYTLDILA